MVSVCIVLWSGWQISCSSFTQNLPKCLLCIIITNKYKKYTCVSAIYYSKTNCPQWNNLRQRWGGLASMAPKSWWHQLGSLSWPNLAVSWTRLEGPRKLLSHTCSQLLHAAACSPQGKLDHSKFRTVRPLSQGGWLPRERKPMPPGYKPQTSLSLNFIVQSKSKDGKLTCLLTPRKRAEGRRVAGGHLGDSPQRRLHWPAQGGHLGAFQT